MSLKEQGLRSVEFARKKKPSGRKDEDRKEKLPNQIRHDQNAAISIASWKKRIDRKIKRVIAPFDGVK